MDYDNPQFIAAVKKILGRYWHPKTERVPPQDTATQGSHQPPEDVPLVTETTPPTEHHKETCYCKPDQTPLWKILLETVAIFVGIYVAYVYHGQLVIMQGQLGEIIKQFPEIQKSANANVKSADQTEIAVRNAADNFRLDQRPWIGVVKVDVSAIGDDPINITVKFTNSGKTPGFNVRTAWETDCRPLNKSGPKPIYAERDSKDRSTVMPGQELLLVNEDTPALTCSPENMGLLRQGKASIWIIGTTWYSDEFQQPHTTDFCFHTQIFKREMGKFSKPGSTANGFTTPCLYHNSAT